ncbi:MAG: penicillin-binding protein 2 [Candidatus Omnitrophica bacterium]|nr:penicillin-binding protein 2 [Candidatus Omnitrophota bacterium]
MRLKIIRVAIFGLFVLIALGLFYTQVIQGQYFARLSTNNRIRVVPVEGWRGQLKDHNGKVLADNRLSYDVMVTPQEIQSTALSSKDSSGLREEEGGESLFRFLGQVLAVDPKAVAQRYSRGKTAPFVPVVVAQDISKEQAIVIEENRYRFPSVLVQESYRRFYPLGENSAHLLGYVGKISTAQRELSDEYGYSMQSIVGHSGVEEYYDSYLRGEAGGVQIEVNSRGQQVRLLGFREAQKGQDITLTIDSDLQQDALELIAQRPGAVVVMDMDSGEVLGLVSSPGFDPNVFVGSRPPGEIGQLFSNPLAPVLNRTIQGAFPPGSVFKVVMAIAGLHTQKIIPDTTFICPGFYQLKRAVFRCTHVHGAQNLIGGLAHSCNVYFYNVGLRLGSETISRYARWMGLGEKTSIDLPYEEDGLIPGREQRALEGKGGWRAGDTLNMSIGQGEIQVTPLQLARLMATVARNGVIVQPHVIKAIGDTPVNQFSYERRVKIDETIFETVRQGLRAAVTDEAGTAHVTDIPGLFLAGKTGTAQTSGGKKTHAWFAGYAKGKNRNIAFCILLEHGGSSFNACLMARDLFSRMMAKNIL